MNVREKNHNRIDNDLPVIASRLACVCWFLFIMGCTSTPPADEYRVTELQRQSAHPKAAFFLMNAQEAFRLENFRGALALVDSAEAYAPELADVAFLRGNILALLAQLEPAAKAYQRVIDLDPYYPSVWYQQGNIVYQRKNYKKALAMYRQERQAALSAEKAFRQKPDKPRHTRTLIQMGRTYIELGEIDSAQEAYEQCLAIDAQYAVAYLDLAALFRENGADEEALDYANRALELEPDNVDFLYIAGSLCVRTGRMQEAVDYLQRVVTKRPSDYGAYYSLGTALVALGRLEEGQRCLARMDTLRSLQGKIAQRKITADTYPENPFQWADLGDQLWSIGRPEAAMKYYQIAHYLAPGNQAISDRIVRLRSEIESRQR